MQNNENFLSSSGFVIYGISPTRKTFAGYVKKNLVNAGYKVFPIYPDAGNGFYRNIVSIPDKVESAYIAVKPENTSKVIEDIEKSGIEKVWLQNGSFKDSILNRCRKAGIEVYTGCLMMYIPNAGFIHKLHKIIHEFLERRR